MYFSLVYSNGFKKWYIEFVQLMGILRGLMEGMILALGRTSHKKSCKETLVDLLCGLFSAQ